MSKIDYLKEHGDIIGEMPPLFYRETCGLKNHYLFDFILEERDNREINFKKQTDIHVSKVSMISLLLF